MVWTNSRGSEDKIEPVSLVGAGDPPHSACMYATSKTHAGAEKPSLSFGFRDQCVGVSVCGCARMCVWFN